MRKIILLAAAAAIASLLSATSYAQPRGKLIVNQLSGKCIDVSGAPGVANGAPLLLWDCERNGKNKDNGSNSDQFWERTQSGKIRNTLSGKCIDIKGRNNGDDLQLWDCDTPGRDSDQTFVFRSDGFIEHRATRKCIDVSGAPGRNNGARLQLWDCELNNPQTDQRWRF
ncbi:MAG TPA: RICIN domain-containing protein [Xanthobacteraceae bacterium]|nr:RICIN domain-containing protein [Xanthobacteraceae bacterium]